LNVLLFDDTDELEPGRVCVRDRRLRHVREILRAKPGDELAVGKLGGRLGRGRIRALGEEELELEVTLERDPPPAHPAVLALALPRPPSLRKVLQQATAMGVKRFLLFGSARVEKSFWQSSALRPDAIRAELVLGLEQAGDTVLPTVERAARAWARACSASRPPSSRCSRAALVDTQTRRSDTRAPWISWRSWSRSA